MLKKPKREWSELILSWKDIDFILFYDFVAEIYKKNRNKWDKIKRKQMELFWQNRLKQMDWDVAENKRLEIGSAGSFSCVFFFFLFLALFEIVN